MIAGAGGVEALVGKIIAGVALIAVAVFVPAAAIGLKSMFAVGMIGAGLALSGTADLLTPTPQLRGPKATSGSGVATSRVTGVEINKGADLESNLFSRDQGTGAQGEAVPWLWPPPGCSAALDLVELRNMPSERDISTAPWAGGLREPDRSDMTESKLIFGAGGGGGGSARSGGGGNTPTPSSTAPTTSPVYNPTYTADDPGLRSTSFAQLQFLVCEGEIYGPDG